MLKERTAVLSWETTLTKSDVDYVLQRVEMMLDLRESERRCERRGVILKVLLVAYFVGQVMLGAMIVWS